MAKSRKYPAHLWTLEFVMNPVLPILSHSFPSEHEAKIAFRSAIPVMATSGGAITSISLWHKNTLQTSAVPPPPPKPLPPPDSSGVRHIPGRGPARTLRPLWHADRTLPKADLLV